MRSRFLGLGLGLTLASFLPAPAVAGGGGTLPPPVDPKVAIEAAFAGARAAGSNAALILFIARNPDTAEAGTARHLLAARRTIDPLPYPGPDGAVLEAFDRARLAGPAALAAFAEIHRDGHPLGTEALKPEWQQPSGP